MNEQIMLHVITQSVFQLWKDVIKTACKQNVTLHFIYLRQVISVYSSLFAIEMKSREEHFEKY